MVVSGVRSSWLTLAENCRGLLQQPVRAVTSWHQQRRTAAFDMAAGEVDGHAVQLHRAFRTLPVQKAEQRFVAADGNHRLSNRVIGDAEHCPRRVVHRQHMPLLVEDDEALLHAAEDGIQLMPLGGQGRHLVGNAGVLLRHPGEAWAKAPRKRRFPAAGQG